MKAITLTQPWATLVAIGAKKIETRSWRTDYRGPLAIHAAKGWTRAVVKLAFSEPFRTILVQAGYKLFSLLPLGKVVATCELVSVIPTRQLLANPVCEWAGPDGRRYRFELDDQEKAFGDYTPGRYAWLLADVRKLDVPVGARGALGLWEWTAPELAQEA